MSEQPIRLTDTGDGRIVPGVIRQLTETQPVIPKYVPTHTGSTAMAMEIADLKAQLAAANARVEELEAADAANKAAILRDWNFTPEHLQKVRDDATPITSRLRGDYGSRQFPPSAIGVVAAERIEQLESTIAALTERAEVRGKLAETFGEVLCQIAGTNDRVRACAIASDQFAAMKERAERAETKIRRWATADLRPTEAEARTYLGRGILILMQDIKETANRISDAHDTARREAGRGE